MSSTQSMSGTRYKTAALVAAVLFAAHEPAPAAGSVEEGQDLAQRLCSACHGIGRAERSPIPVAPAFRRLETRVDLDRMIERLQDGIIAGHPEMPAFVLREHEARALVAYMRSLRDN
jgi:cytochrome c